MNQAWLTANVRDSEFDTWENMSGPQGALTPHGPNHRYYSTEPRSEG